MYKGVVFGAFFIYTVGMRILRVLFCGCLLLPVWGWALETDPEPVSVREDAFLIQKEIVTWRTDQAGAGQAWTYNCQAVRIHPHWFLTAAHCVYSACRDSYPCTVQITLAEEKLRQTVRINHSPTDRKVFIYEGFFPGQNRISSVDVALIKLDPQTAEYKYEVQREGQWLPVTRSQFNRLLAESPEAKAQLRADNIRLIGAVNLPDARFLPRIVIPRVTEGVISYVPSSNGVFFVKELRHFISPVLQVRRGNSGGGVFTEQGDLVGVVSAMWYGADGNASFQNEDGKTVVTLQNANEHFLFTGFNGSTLNFIRTHVPGVRTIGAENGFIKPTGKEVDFQTLVKHIVRAPLRQ